MAKEAFNRKRSIFCGLLEKELRKRLVKCFVWSIVLYDAETWTLRRNEQKQLEAFEMCVWRRMERVKWTDKIKNSVVLERVGEGRIMLELIRKRKRNWLGHWLRRNCLLKDALEHGCAKVTRCVTARWRNFSHYCSSLRQYDVFWAQRSTDRGADSRRCTQTSDWSPRAKYIVRHWASREASLRHSSGWGTEAFPLSSVICAPVL